MIFKKSSKYLGLLALGLFGFTGQVSAQSNSQLIAQVTGFVLNSNQCNRNIQFSNGSTGHVCDFNSFMNMLFVTGFGGQLEAPLGSLRLKLHHENRKGANLMTYRFGPEAHDNSSQQKKLGIWKSPPAPLQVKIKMNDVNLDEYRPRPAYPNVLARIGFEERGIEVETELCEGRCRAVDDYRIPDIHINNMEGNIEIKFRDNARLYVDSVCGSGFNMRVALRGQIDIGDTVADAVNTKFNSCKMYDPLKNGINAALSNAFSNPLAKKFFGTPYLRDKKLFFVKPKS
jgi:hypothetical protein